jgi:hypothetical protein
MHWKISLKTILRKPRKLYRLAVVLFVAIGAVTLSIRQAHGVVKVWKGTTSSSWNTAANWSPSGVPGSSDVATFDNTCTNCDVTIDTNASVAGMDMQSSYTGTITQTTFTISSGITGWTFNGGTLIGGVSATITSNGALTMNGGTITLSAGTWNQAGAFTMNGGTINLSSATWNQIGKNFSYTAGTINYSTSTVVFTGGNPAPTITGSLSLYNVKFNGGFNANSTSIASGTVITAVGTTTINPTFSSYGGCAGPGQISVQGNLVENGTAVTASSCVVSIDGTDNQTFSGVGTALLGKIIINKSSGTLSLSGTIHNGGASGSVFTHTAGIIDPGTSTMTITGVFSLYNVTLTGVDNATVTFASGTVVTALGTTTLLPSASYMRAVGPGQISAKGDIINTGSGVTWNHNMTFILNITGTGDQTFTGGNADWGSVIINKPSGTLHLVGTIVLDQSLTYTAGAVDYGTSTVNMPRGTVSGSIDLYNFTSIGYTDSDVLIIASGTTVTVHGTTTIGKSPYGQVNGPGTINALGNLTVNRISGNVNLKLSGGNNQSITNFVQGISGFAGTMTVNKTGGVVSLNIDVTAFLFTSLAVTSGIFNMNGHSIKVTALSIASTGSLRNTGAGGTLTLGGNAVNNGSVIIRGNNTCGGTDVVGISSNNTTPRAWSGSGTYIIEDATLNYTTISPATTVYSSTLTGTTTGFTNDASCPAHPSATGLPTGKINLGTGKITFSNM